MIKRFILAAAALGAAALLALPLAQTAQAAPRELRRRPLIRWRTKRVVEVSEQLRCLVCQNQSIAESMRNLPLTCATRVIEQVKAGKTNQEIVDYMVDRYGDFVLYKPPFKLSTAILWLGPLCLFLIGIGAFYINLRRRKRLVAESVKPLTAQEKAMADDLLSGRKGNRK